MVHIDISFFLAFQLFKFFFASTRAAGSSLKTQLFEGATNNLPDDDSCGNARKIENMAKQLTADDIFLVLISGNESQSSLVRQTFVNVIFLDTKPCKIVLSLLINEIQ